MPAKRPTARQVTAAAKSGRVRAASGPSVPCMAMQTSAKAKRAQTSAKAPPPPQNAPYDVTSMARILRPSAASRWMMPALAAMTPQYVEMILRAALMGDYVRQWQLFDLMFDTWPELASVWGELTEGATRASLTIDAYAEEGEPPSDEALAKQKTVSAALRSMRPAPGEDANNADNTIRDLLDGWIRGAVAMEIDWQSCDCGRVGTIVAPRVSWFVHPSNCGWDANGNLGMYIAGGGMSYLTAGGGGGVVPFLPDKFLVGIHKAKSGPAAGGALSRLRRPRRRPCEEPPSRPNSLLPAQGRNSEPIIIVRLAEL